MADGFPPVFTRGQSAAFILIGNIGDVLLLEPCIRHLHERGVAIDLYCTAETTMVWEGDPRLRKQVPVRSGNTKYQSGKGVDPWKVKKERYDYLFDFVPTSRSAKVALRLSAELRVTWSAYQKPSRQLLRTILYNHRLPFADPHLRRDRYYVTLLGLTGTEADTVLPARISATPEELAAFRKQHAFFSKKPAPAEQLLMLQPTARWKRKLWTVEKWRSLIGELQKRPGMRLGMISGPVAEEQELAQTIAQGLLPAEAVFAGTLSWGDLRRALALTDGFVGLDSAPYHLAAMLGKPLVVLFGEAGVENWGPVLPRQSAIKAPLIDGAYVTAEITVSEVLSRLDAALKGT